MKTRNICRICFLLISMIVLCFIFVIFKEEKTELQDNEEKIEKKVEEKTEIKKTYLGEFILTAYCGCEECCEEYALNRPIDENGKAIVYGSIGERLFQGVSVAVDPSVIPYGSKIEIDGEVYIAQDCGGAISGNRIDVYHDSHQDALNFGVQTKSVYIIEG